MIIFLYGDNDFKIHQKVKELKEKFIKEIDPSEQNIWKLEGEKIKVEDLSSKLGSSSLFISKKMLIISNLIKNKQKDFFKTILEYIKKNKISDSPDILIFTEQYLKNKNNKGLVKINNEKESPLNTSEKSFFEFLLQEKYAQEIKKFNNQELINFIQKEFKNYSLQIENREAQEIINLTAADPWMIKNEIKKLSHLKLSNPNNKKIEKKDIQENIFEKHQENIFAFTDSISSRNIKHSLDILEKQYLADLEPDYILNMLIRQFKILLQIKEALELNFNTNKIINKLKLHPFIINKGINQARNFDKKTLKNIINQLIDLDKKNRSEFCDLRSEINLVINKL
jgi:DNA polymerase-3 subunit delta